MITKKDYDYVQKIFQVLQNNNFTSEMDQNIKLMIKQYPDDSNFLQSDVFTSYLERGILQDRKLNSEVIKIYRERQVN